MSWINTIDHQILLFVQSIRIESLNEFVKAIGYLGTGGAVWIFLILILLVNKRTRKAAVAATVSLIISMIICYVIKFSVARIRPYEMFDDIICLVKPQWDYTFPSGHTCSSFSVSVALHRQAKSRLSKFGSLLTVILACLIGFSRIYVGVHFTTDVLAGAMIGLLTAIIVTKVVNRLSFHKSHKVSKRRKS